MGTKVITHEEREEIKALLVGRSIVRVGGTTLHLDDGRELHVIPNEGCGGCDYGNFEITHLNESPVNVITNVEFDYDLGEDDTKSYGPMEKYTIFVWAEDEKLKLLQVEGSDNGWYGVGFKIEVQG